MIWTGHVARMGRRGMHTGFGGKGRRKETARLPRNRRDNSMRMDLREIGRYHVGCVHLAQDRDQWRNLVTNVMNFRTE
jgi:hypothetical protein